MNKLDYCPTKVGYILIQQSGKIKFPLILEKQAQNQRIEQIFKISCCRVFK